MSGEPPANIHQLFEQGTEIDKALGRAARQAREAHKRAGLPLPVWRDGRTVWLTPEEIDEGNSGTHRHTEG